MAKSKYTRRRRIIQGLALLVLICVPLRLICFDTETDCIRLLGMQFGLSTMFYPLFTVVGLFLYVVVAGMKKGRLLCSHLCPMHMFLESVNTPKAKTSGTRNKQIWIWSPLLALFLTEVILSFFQPVSSRIQMIADGNWAVLGIGTALFGGFMLLFVGYQERFCKKGCPYALIQMLLQSENTRYMEFANPEKTCTNCRGCDNICPFNLRARFESNGHDCTNCNLCAEACTDELGQGNTLFHLIDPEPDAIGADEPR